MIDDIDGLQELLDACVKIEKDAAKRIMKAVKPIMEAMNAEATSKAPIDTGSLQQSFDFRLKSFDKGTVVWGIQTAIYGIHETDKGRRIPSKYLHLVSGGTKQRKTKDNKNRGSATANTFYRELMKKYDKLIQEAIDSVLDEIENEIP